TLRSATFTVSKVYSPTGPTTAVSVNASCSSGSIDATPKNASPGSPAVFTVTGFSAGATCSASEAAVPQGYSESDNCSNVSLNNHSDAPCTITNTQRSATFTVSKVYSPSGPTTAVTVNASCSTRTLDAASKPASPGSPAVFTVTGFDAGATCSASEATVPAGYVESDNCQTKAMTTGQDTPCTITNTLRSATFTVSKVYSPSGPTTAVSVNASCSSGSIDATPKNAAPGSPSVCTVTGFSAGATCSASEATVPTGYVESDNCQGVSLNNGGDAPCTIT